MNRNIIEATIMHRGKVILRVI